MDKPPVRVLLVDDDRDDYLLTRELFAEMSGEYVLDWVADYDLALKRLCRGEHDVYLLDYRLGRRNGLELLREAGAKNCRGLAIVLTGQGERDIDLAAMQAGAADYLDKGRLDAALLERSIRYALQHKRHEEALEQRVDERTAELAHANAALQEAARRKDEFLAMLAHELRNPLAAIHNAQQIMRLAGENRSAADSAVEIMERQVVHMTRLVDDLLDMSRISRGRIELRTERIELAPVVRHAVESVRALAEGLRHELTVTLPPEPIHLDGDATRLAQVIGNLLNNACKYSENGGNIRLTVERGGEQAIIRIRDTGIGLAPDELGRIFDMFTQVDASSKRSQSGLGIGLTLVKSLVEMHGGTVEAHSAGIGQGSEFVVRLPVLVATTRSPQPTVSEPAPATARRILVVVDNGDAASSLATMLTSAGNKTCIVQDGLEAVEVAATFRPDVVLLDIGLPKLNGYEAARRIRQAPWGKSIVLVALTGGGQDEHRQKSAAAGFNGHMVKPVDPATLMRLLASQPAGRA